MEIRGIREDGRTGLMAMGRRWTGLEVDFGIGILALLRGSEA